MISYFYMNTTLQVQIKEDMKTAMKAKESQKVMALRGLMSACTNRAIAQNMGPQGILSDDEVIAVLKTEAKRRKDAIIQYTDAGREELAADEKMELEIIQGYLPEVMDKDAIEKIIREKIVALGGTLDPTVKGKFMGELMGELKGKADGGDVKEVLDMILNA